MKKVLLGLIALVAILVVVIATRPADYTISRSATVSAPVDIAYATLTSFKAFGDWSPWDKLDPNMKRTFEGNDGAQGSSYHWSGNDKVGEGKMTITALTPNAKVEMDLHFIKPFESKAETIFEVAADGAGTKVTWTMHGHNNFMGKAFGLFMNMDKMVGADFEKGLAQLGPIVEAAAKKRAEEEARAKAEAEAKAKAEAEAAAAADAAAAAEAEKTKGKGKKKG